MASNITEPPEKLTNFWFFDKKASVPLPYVSAERLVSFGLLTAVTFVPFRSGDRFSHPLSQETKRLKIHLIINQLGKIVNFELTPANVSDNNAQLLQKIFGNLKGSCYGDKGYLFKLLDFFYQNGLKLVTKIRSNIKNVFVQLNEKLNLKKRAVIELVNDILMSVFNIEHTKDRSPSNAFILLEH